MALFPDAASSLPQIVENYRDYEPPRQLRGMVEELLKEVPAKYLVGLKTIVLTNKKALSRDERRQKVWSRNRKSSLAEARGAYSKATRSSAAHVMILVDNTLSMWPAWILRAPLFGYAAISEILYHEIGHHIHLAIEPVYDGEENVAESWQRKLATRFTRKRYWFLRPILYLMSKLHKKVIRKTATWKRMEADSRRH